MAELGNKARESSRKGWRPLLRSTPSQGRFMMYRQTPIIAANWKLNKTIPEALEFMQGLVQEESTFDDRTVIVAPPFTALHAVAGIMQHSSIGLAAQDVARAESGAFTGEVSASMLADAGCSHVIIGHSERRSLFGETDEEVNQKVIRALKANLKPIVCVGETLQERESEKTLATVERQIREGLINMASDDIRSVIVAYEPVWAIGTGKTATPGQAAEVHLFIKKIVGAMAGDRKDGWTVPVIYGGSVNDKTIDELMSRDGIDGALVGGASLELQSFLNIIRFRAT